MNNVVELGLGINVFFVVANSRSYESSAWGTLLSRGPIISTLRFFRYRVKIVGKV